MTTLSTDTAYEALTRRAGLVDRSERGKLLLTGAEAKDFLHGQVTNDIESLTPGTGCYAAFLTHKGKMLGDLRILDGGDAGLFLDTERSALQELFNMIRRYKLGREVELHKRTLERALLSLIGPDARLLDGPEHTHELREVGGVPVRLVATDLGTDVICDAGDAGTVKAALGVEEVDPAVAEIVRVESGRPRYGVDIDDATIPQEAGLNERAVNFEKGCYVGQETVARLFYRGKPNRNLRGLKLSGSVGSGTALVLGEKQVGTLTSVVESPVHGTIGLALVRREAPPGTTVDAGGTPAEVVELPFTAAY